MPDTASLNSSPAKPAAAGAALSEGAVAALKPDATAVDFMGALTNLEMFSDAIKFLAQALEPKKSVAWSLKSIKEVAPPEAPEEKSALTAVEKWVAEPNDKHRRSAKSASEEAGVDTPAGCLAAAVFFVEGSIAPPDVQPLPPPPHIAGRLAACAIIMAVLAQPKEAAERYRKSIALGLKS